MVIYDEVRDEYYPDDRDLTSPWEGDRILVEQFRDGSWRCADEAGDEDRGAVWRTVREVRFVDGRLIASLVDGLTVDVTDGAVTA